MDSTLCLCNFFVNRNDLFFYLFRNRKPFYNGPDFLNSCMKMLSMILMRICMLMYMFILFCPLYRNLHMGSDDSAFFRFIYGKADLWDPHLI